MVKLPKADVDQQICLLAVFFRYGRTDGVEGHQPIATYKYVAAKMRLTISSVRAVVYDHMRLIENG